MFIIIKLFKIKHNTRHVSAYSFHQVINLKSKLTVHSTKNVKVNKTTLKCDAQIK